MIHCFVTSKDTTKPMSPINGKSYEKNTLFIKSSWKLDVTTNKHNPDGEIIVPLTNNTFPIRVSSPVTGPV